MRLLFMTWILAFVLIVNCRGAIIQVPEDHATIQDGITAAVDGDTVLVAPGTWSGPGNRDIELLGKAVLLTSENGPETCIIDCYDPDNMCRGFHFRAQESNATVIDGFSVINGYQNEGAGVLCQSASPTITNCIFQHNDSSLGGTIQGYNSELRITDCQIVNNSGYFGGGIYLKACDADIIGCQISNNIVERWGGGMYLNSSTVVVTQSDISDNSILLDMKVNSGGGIYSDYSDLTIDDCVISGNRSPAQGGGIFHNSPLYLTRSIIANNSAESGGGVYNQETDESLSVYGGEPSASNTFDSNFAFSGADLDCIDISTNIEATYNHFTGYYLSDFYIENRQNYDLSNSTSEMIPIRNNVYVSPDGDDENDGLTPETAFKTILHAIQRVYGTDTAPVCILLTPGIYSPTLTGETLPIPLVSHVNIHGTGSADDTVIDGEQIKGCCYGINDTVSISNVTLTNGYPSGIRVHDSILTLTNSVISNNRSSGHGGGIYAEDTTLQLSHCDVTGNTADGDGGGVWYYQSQVSSPSIIITNCNIRNNTATGTGGGFRCLVSGQHIVKTIMDSSIIENNTAGTGGGISCYSNYYENNHLFTFSNSVISGNTATSIYQGGGGILAEGCWNISQCDIKNNTAEEGSAINLNHETTLSVINCVIANNTSNGGTVTSCSGTKRLDIINCTIAGNTGLRPDTGTLNLATGNYGTNENDIRNTILWDNTPQQQIYWTPRQNATLTVMNSCIQGGYPGVGCIADDPLLISETDFQLQTDSPCIDAGTHVNAPLMDRNGLVRPAGGDVDMGAFESAHWPAQPRPYLAMSDLNLAPGDTVSCWVGLWNPHPDPLVDKPLFTILDAFGALYFAPSFSDYDYYLQSFPPGLTTITVLPEFIWPNGVSSTSGLIWYAALTDAQVTTLESAIDTLIFDITNFQNK